LSIRILQDKCVGCGRCAEVCPGTLIALIDSKAAIRRPERCWGCASCLKECPAAAIEYYLGSDMGGLGGVLTVRREKSLLHWRIMTAGNSVTTITVDSRDANKY